MDGDAPITEDEVRDLVLGFFHATHVGGPGEVLLPMFAEGVGVEMWFGPCFALDAFLELHGAFVRQRHTLLELAVQPLPGGRVRAVGEVEWEAVIRETGALVQAVVVGDWIVERSDDGGVRFARCASTDIRYLPGSAMLEI